MKRILILLSFLFLFFLANAQKYITKNGYIGFFSHTPVEDIKADNNQVATVLDISTGELVFQVLIKSFKFQKALMEVHFNENYLESDKFPKSTFTGRITNLTEVDFSKNGTFDVNVEGDLNIHGISKKMAAKGSLEVVDGGINASSKFTLIPEEFNVRIPSVVRNNIAKTIEVTAVLKLAPLQGGK